VKRNIIIFVLLFICIICTYTFEMSDLSVADFTLIHEPTGKIFSFYDSPKRFFDIMGEERELKEDGETINNDFFYIWYRESNYLFASVDTYGFVSAVRDQLKGYIINQLKVHKDFRTIRGIGIDSTLEEILSKYDNCYVGNINKSWWGIFDESVELCTKEVIKQNKEIDSAFLVCEFKDYDRLFDIKMREGIYYVIEFKLDENKKVSSIGFSVVPYLP